MLRRLFPEDSNQFNFLQNIFKSFDKEFIDRLEMFFPMWCMFAYQHYLAKSFDIAIFRSMEINLNTNYVISMIREDLSKDEYKEIENVLTRVYPFIKLNDIDTNGIIELIHNDKKNEAGKIYTVLLQGIGSSTYHNEVSEKELGEALLHISMLSDIYN